MSGLYWYCVFHSYFRVPTQSRSGHCCTSGNNLSLASHYAAATELPLTEMRIKYLVIACKKCSKGNG